MAARSPGIMHGVCVCVCVCVMTGETFDLEYVIELRLQSEHAGSIKALSELTLGHSVHAVPLVGFHCKTPHF